MLVQNNHCKHAMVRLVAEAGMGEDPAEIPAPVGAGPPHLWDEQQKCYAVSIPSGREVFWDGRKAGRGQNWAGKGQAGGWFRNGTGMGTEIEVAIKSYPPNWFMCQ